MLYFKQTRLTVLLLGITSAISAQTISWSTDIAPILYQHCASCHRDGGLGGFSLIGFDNAYTYRESIVNAVQAKRMPPWKADPTYRHYTGENILTATEIQKITNWVADNAPAGNLALAPAEPVFLETSAIGIPDEVLFTPAYTMTASTDEYRCFVIPSGLLTTQYLRGLEVIPGNHAAVHHVLIYEDITGQAKQLDDQTAEPGYISFGGPGVQGANLVGAWVPGNRPYLLPPNMGIKLSANADLVIQVHFPGSATGLTDMSRLNLFFTPSNQGIREVNLTPVLNHSAFSLENGPLSIPANTTKDYHAKYTMPITASVISVSPHMHLIGRSMTTFGVTLQNDTIPFARIPEWDFHWQGAYVFQKLQKVPIGAKLHAYAHYDNTINNPLNPSNPPQLVVQGESTTDEMMLVYFMYTNYLPGDENIVLDSTLLSSATQPIPFAPKAIASVRVAPNPVAHTPVVVEYELVENSDLTLRVCDAAGRVLQILSEQHNLAPGTYRQTVNTENWPTGICFVQAVTPQGTMMTVQVMVE